MTSKVRLLYPLRWLLAAAIVMLLWSSCSDDSAQPFDAESWQRWTLGTSRLDLADGAIALADGKTEHEVEQLLGPSNVKPIDQDGFAGCPLCLVYNLRANGFGDDFLVLPVKDGRVGRGFVQWRRFN